MTQIVRAHYDGKAIIPDEPVDLPVGQPLVIECRLASAETNIPDRATIEDRLKRLAAATGCVSAPTIPAEALRRENLYE